MSTSSAFSSSGIASISAASRASWPSNTSRCDLVARYAPPAIETPDATIADRPPMSTTRGSMLAPPTPASTPSGAESIRNVIYGVNDGLTATLGVLAGVGGASIDPRVVLIGGLSAMVASGVSMAGGAYLATKSQREVFESQLAREAAEIEAMPELEKAELVDIYRSKGLTAEEAKTIVDRITKDKKVWLETQAREELGLDVSQFENPAREGLVAGISTLVGGAIPVIGYLIGRLLTGSSLSGLGSLAIAAIFSGAFLFLIGSARSFFTGKGGVRSGLEMLAVGSVVAAITYGVGVLFRTH